MAITVSVSVQNLLLYAQISDLRYVEIVCSFFLLKMYVGKIGTCFKAYGLHLSQFFYDGCSYPNLLRL